MKVSKGETSFGTYKNPGTWKRNTTKSDKAKQQNGYIEGASITIDIILPRNAKPARDYVPPFKSLLTHEIQHLFLYYAVNKRSYKLSTTPLVNKKGKTLYFDQNKLPIKSYLSAGQYLESFKKAQDDYKKLYQNSGLNYNDLQKYKIYYDQAMFLYSIMYNIDEDEMKSFVAQVATEASQIPNLTYQNYKEYLPKFTAYNKIKKIEEFYNQIINLQKVADGESNDETKNKNAKPSKKSQDDAQYQLDAISSILKQYGNYKGETTYDNIDQLLQNIQTAQTNLDNNFYSSLYKWLVAKKRVNTNSKPYWTIPGYKSSDSSFKI